jgi:hypothetical protein
MAEPTLTTDELHSLDFFITEAKDLGLSVNWMQIAQAVGEIMQGIPFVRPGVTYDDGIPTKVRTAIIEALKAPGLSLDDLTRIRKILRCL